MAAWSTTVSFAGGALRRDDLVSSGVRGLYATFAMVVLASIGLWTALLTRDFSLEYVASHISANMPSVYIFTSFWSGQAGSMLFWALILSMYGTIAIATSRDAQPRAHAVGDGHARRRSCCSSSRRSASRRIRSRASTSFPPTARE